VTATRTRVIGDRLSSGVVQIQKINQRVEGPRFRVEVHRCLMNEGF
jgi:hypothetical protein